jgi:uncharacterized protein (DUF302 family)
VDDFFETRIPGKLADVQSALDAALKSHKLGTLHVHDVRATLAAKGVDFNTPLVIMDICNPGYAKRVLEATQNRIAPLLPCSIGLWQEGTNVVIRLVRPSALARFFPGTPELNVVAAEVETAVLAAIDELAGAKASPASPGRV